MYKILLYVIYFGAFQMSCNEKSRRYRKQLETVNKLLTSFSKNDSVAVQHMMGVPMKEIGSNKEIINSEVVKAGNLLREYGIPDKDKYVLKEYPDKSPELVDILVPIVDEGHRSGRLIDASLVFSFVKYIPADKIIIFHINTKYKPTLIEAPLEPDSIGFSK